MSGLAQCLLSTGNIDEAELLFRRVLQWREVMLGIDHPQTLQCKRDLDDFLARHRGKSQLEIQKAEEFVDSLPLHGNNGLLESKARMTVLPIPQSKHVVNHA